jgi:hypothetical protein
MENPQENIVIDAGVQINNNEIEYIQKFIHKYYDCISKSQYYYEHLAKRIELIEWLINDFETKKYNILLNSLIVEYQDDDTDENNYYVSYWNQNIYPTEPKFIELFYVVQDVMFGEYNGYEFQGHPNDVNRDEQWKKEARVTQYKRYFGNYADLRIFEH